MWLFKLFLRGLWPFLFFAASAPTSAASAATVTVTLTATAAVETTATADAADDAVAVETAEAALQYLQGAKLFL